MNFNKTNKDYDFRKLLFQISWYKPTLYSPKKRLLNRCKLESDREMRKLRNQKFEISREINLKIAHRWYRTPRSDLSQNHPQFLIKKFRRAFSLTDVVQNEIFIWERFLLDNYFNLLWTYQIHNFCAEKPFYFRCVIPNLLTVTSAISTQFWNKCDGSDSSFDTQICQFTNFISHLDLNIKFSELGYVKEPNIIEFVMKATRLLVLISLQLML